MSHFVWVIFQWETTWLLGCISVFWWGNRCSYADNEFNKERYFERKWMGEWISSWWSCMFYDTRFRIVLFNIFCYKCSTNNHNWILIETYSKPRTWPTILFRLWVRPGHMWESELFWFLTNYFFIIPKAIIYDHLKTIISISFIALRIALPRLREKLEDKEPGVQAAAVNVICELARKNPKQYLPLSPVLLKLMNKSSNNWVLIKIIKLFGSLIQFEPRLGMSLNWPMGPRRLKPSKTSHF